MREVIDGFFRERSIVNHHIASFNDFVAHPRNLNSKIQEIIDNLRLTEEESVPGQFRLDVDKPGEENIVIRIGLPRRDDGLVDPNSEPSIRINKPVVKEANGSSHAIT